MNSVHDTGSAGTVGDLSGFRRELYRCLTRRADGRLVPAVDITSWLRPEAHTCPQRILCHTYGRAKNTAQMIPGWPYSVVVALEIEGTVIRLDVDRLPSGAIPKPVWLWHSVIDLDAGEAEVLWQAFLRRFDIEHTVDIRRPWEKPSAPQRLTPARVRRGFRHLRRKAACPARAPKPSRPGPGQPAGHRNQRPAPRYDVHIKTASDKKPSRTAGPRPRRKSTKQQLREQASAGYRLGIRR